MKLLNRLTLTLALVTGAALVTTGVATPVLLSGSTGGVRTPHTSETTPAPQAASAAPGTPDGDDLADAGSEIASPEMLEAMQRDLGLSKTQAIARVIKESKAQDTEAQLQSELGKAFVGAYLTDKDGQLTVAVTDEAAAAKVRAARAIPQVVTRSAADLEAVQAALDDRAEVATPAGIASWYVDVQANSITVEAASKAAAKAFIKAAGVDSTAVRVSITSELPNTLADLRGGDAYYIDMRARCSIGFSVKGGFVTAGHCGGVGSVTYGFNRKAQGKVAGSRFPGNDWAWVRTTGWTPKPWVKGEDKKGAEKNILVRGSKEATVGASICRSGSTTGWRCGKVTAKKATVRYAQGTVTGLTRTSACAEPGDSGGSFISGGQAQGVASGGNGSCGGGGYTYFQPVNPILKQFKLTLVISKAPKPTSSPATP